MDERSRRAVYDAVDALALRVSAGVAPDERSGLISDGLVDLLAAITDQPSSAIPRHEPLLIESLQAAHLQAVLDAALGVTLSLADLAAGVSVATVTRLLLESPAGSVGLALPEVTADPEARFEPFDLTDVQQAYFFGREHAHELGDVDASFYVELATVNLDVDRFERALRAAIAQHDMLRAVVLADGRQQVLREVPDYSILSNDLSPLSPADQQASVQALRDELTSTRRDVGSWPLFDVRASALGGSEGLLHISFDLLICDGASFARLLEELAGRYAEPDRQWPELELTFRDYLSAVGQAENGPDYERAKAYWMNRLQALPPAPELPQAKPLSAIESPRFHRRNHRVPAAAWQAFKDRAAQRGLTPSTALAAAYADVLARWSRSAEFTVNLTVNNRQPVCEQVRDVVGDFTSLTLLQVSHDGRQPFTQRAKNLQAQLWQDLDHRAYSAVRVMRELARRSGPAAAVAPVVFSTFVGAGFSDDFDPEWLTDIGYTSAQAPQLSLESLVLEYRGALNLTWDTVDEAFAPGVLDEMFAAYRDLITRLAHDDQAWELSDTVPLPQSQLAVRDRVNLTSGPIPGELLHRLGSALAERRADPAVITGDRVLSYADLDRLACRIGRGLRGSGAEVNRLVAVVMDKGWEQVGAVLGVLYSGAAYLPIDASLPADRIRRLLELGEVNLVLSQKAVLDRLDWPGDVSVFAVDDPGLWSDEDDAPLADPQSSDDLAYVIFTSGSTGEPKGVMIDHRGAANTCLDINTRFGIDSDDRVLGLSSLSFDLSVWDIFGILAAGGALVLPEADAGRDPERWARLVKAHHVTVWNTVPALMQMYVTYCEAQPSLGGLSSLRLVMMSGDWIEVTLADRITAQKSDPIQVISLGGATEASIWSVYHPIGEHDPAWKSVPYGTPLTNQSLHILDECGRPRPDWVPGQLFIGGIGVACGYWRDSKRTSQRFSIDPATGHRRYSTGDLGRYHPDGTIEFLGRDDGQVKVNGYRIELGEIEHALASHPGVDRAVALADGNRLLSFVTAHPGQDEEQESTTRAQVAEWHEVFDSLRAGSAAQTAGWTDTFTGLPIAEQDMRSWAEVTIGRVLAHQPRRVLEIGCGAGLITTGLISECVEYVGTDLSGRTLDYLSARIEQAGAPGKVTLLAREARDFSDLPTGHFDCVVLNSVLQYFPSAQYLSDTVRGALAALRPGGVLYLGDVRDLRALPAFHAAVERARSTAETDIRDVTWRIQERALTENELVVDPLLFWSGFGVPAAVLPRPGRDCTEMADYRYDVLLFSDSAEPITFSASVDWSDRDATLAELTGMLGAGVRSVRVRDVPNQRLASDEAWAELLSEPTALAMSLPEYSELVLRERCTAAGASPLELIEVAREHGYECEVFYRPDARVGVFDAVFTRSAFDGAAAARTYAAGLAPAADPAQLTNNPLAGRRTVTLPQEVKRHASEILPAYMVPSEIVVVASMPLTANGKVDIARLRGIAAGRGQSPARVADAGPRDATEKALAAAWQQTLGVAAVSVHDNFFLTGGDSLLAVRLVRAAAESGITVTVEEVFAHPSIAELAEFARGRQPSDGAAGSVELPRIEPAPDQRWEPFPLTDLQQAYLLGRNGFFDLGNVAASFYVELSVEHLDAQRLGAAVRAMVERHDMLRAVIGLDGQWHVLPEVAPYDLAVNDLRRLDQEEAEAELERVRRQTSAHIFDPGSFPLFDVRVSQLQQGSRIHVTLDLLIADGGTVAAFFTELSARYADPERTWPELELTFRDYHLAMAGIEQGPRFERARDYWTARAAQLPAAPQLRLAQDPADILDPHFVRRTHRLSESTWRQFKQAAAQHGVTASAALATAYASVLAAWSGRAPFTLNVTINNRLDVHPQVAEVLGDFTTVTLLEVEQSSGRGFSERARALQSRLAQDLDHSEFTGIRVMREIARLHGQERANMPVVFTSALDSAGADFGQAVSGLGEMAAGIVHTPQVHLDHQVFEYAGELVLNWDSVQELYAEQDIDDMFTEYVTLVRRLADTSAWEAPDLDPAGPHAPASRTSRPALAATPALPRTASQNSEAERVLAGIWSQVLGVEHIDPTTDFTELGGDSLLALQVIARAAAVGLTISPREFFANQSVAALAAIARAEGAGVQDAAVGDAALAAADGEVAGGVGLMPRQLALLQKWRHPARHNYVLLFDVAEPLEQTALKVALRAVLRHHDGLRLSFRHGESGWSAAASAMTDLDTPLTWVDLTAAAGTAGAETVKQTCLELQTGIELEVAPLLSLAYFQWAGRQQLLIVVNQLIVDNYSCRVLCEDLLTAYGQVVANGEAALAPADSVLAWAQSQRSLAADPGIQREQSYWRELAERPVQAVSVEVQAPGTAMIALDQRATAAVLETESVGDILLCAVARALGRRGGQDTVRVDVDAHGRDVEATSLNPARVIGRLSTRWPLDVPASWDLSLRDAAKAVAGARARTPAGGRHHELLVQFAAAQAQTTPGPVRVNYLGRADGLWAPLGLSLSPDHPGLAPTGEPEDEQLEILAGIVDGRLLVACTPGAAGLLEEIGTEITTGLLGEQGSLAVPPEAETLRHWLGHR
ncbi:MAG TPA: amino acid adenylation domain-containing protein [Jatrophihabitans sp.]|jgi:amino acid adenylation domain-containing protein|uniref:amino acid adenylation domain-containing protein n=1 Tax=Jatrophihabitans sp. TaxID=1932789 RepID=UPI002F15CA0F